MEFQDTFEFPLTHSALVRFIYRKLNCYTYLVMVSLLAEDLLFFSVCISMPPLWWEKSKGSPRMYLKINEMIIMANITA